MGFPIDHLSDNQLAALGAGEVADAGLEYHVARCMECKRRLAGALLLGGLFRPLEDKIGNHLGAPKLDRLHAVLFEGDNAEDFNWLQEYRHVRSCNPCFTKFFNLHVQLSPSTASIERAKRAFANSLPARRLGRLTIGTAWREAWMTFQAELEELAEKTGIEALLRGLASKDRRGLEERMPHRPRFTPLRSLGSDAELPAALPDRALSDEESFLSASEGLQLSYSIPRAPAGETVALEDVQLSLDVTVGDEEQVTLQVAAVDIKSGAPRSNVYLEACAGELPVSSSLTGQDGRCSLYLPKDADRLLIRRVGVDQKPWEIELQVNSPDL